ncbi:MAG: TonB-dependent receptor [Dysgonamonadaceae bacterium]|jgi:hypothetical protein|nr:TonB-dependent receptor [Dysgonamonadaceae bacterium]
MKKNLYLFLLLFFSVSAFSQTTSLKGMIVSSSTNMPIPGISIQLQNSGLSAISSFDGSFLFEGISPGEDRLFISSPEINNSEMTVDIIENQTNDIGTVYVSENARKLFSEGAFTLIDEEDIGEEDQSSHNVSSLMTASNDVYISSTSWNFAAMRFKLRGYDYRYSNMYINGINFNDPERGGFSYGMIGGLNDATRSKDVVNGLNPSTFTFGQIGGSGNIITNAANFSRGTRVGLAYTNRAYTLRGSALHSTGLMKNGWAVTASVAYRWADEGFIEGTFYNSLGYLLSIEKEINSRHSISFTTIGAPTQRAQQSSNFQETVDLVGSIYYNSYWGWQNGEKRNSRVVTTFEPIAILSHVFKINAETKLTTGLGFKYTTYGQTRLNWINSASPQPDYYRYLPSYQTTSVMKDFYTGLWESRNPNVTQVDWERMYRVNHLQKLSGSGDALYMVEERRNDQMYFSFNSTFNTKLNEHTSFTAGLSANTTKGMHYNTVSDLLGADYLTDIDQFVIRDLNHDPNIENIKQNDMNNPNRKVVEGDRFSYDYNIYVNTADLWARNTHRYNKWDIYYGFNLVYTEFWREGNMRNGRAPENSYGKGDVYSSFDQSVKLGLTYKLSGKHIFSGNVSYSTLAPLTYDSYVSARTRDEMTPNLQSEKIFASDLGYSLTTPIFRGSISVFQTNFYDQTRLYPYYSDSENTFINHILTGINKMHRGVELGLKAKVTSNITLTLAGTVAEYIYSNRPTGIVAFENNKETLPAETVYFKNFYVGGTPQTAGTFGIQYFYKYWFFNLDINGFDRTYVDIAPSRRTESAFNFTANSYEEYVDAIKQMMTQERFAGGFTLDFSVGKSFRLDSKHYLNVNLQFKNMLNNTDLKTGGYEQGRLYVDKITQNYDMERFPNKYYWAQGFNCYLMAALRF